MASLLYQMVEVRMRLSGRCVLRFSPLLQFMVLLLNPLSNFSWLCQIFCTFLDILSCKFVGPYYRSFCSQIMLCPHFPPWGCFFFLYIQKENEQCICLQNKYLTLFLSQRPEILCERQTQGDEELGGLT